MSTAFAHAALAIAAAFFDSLWEGALIAGAVWLGLRCLPKLGASTRYAIWLFALAAIVVTPILTVRLSGQAPEPARTVPAVIVLRSTGSVVPPVQRRADPVQRQPGAAQAAPATPDAAAEAVPPAPAASRKSHITIPPSVAVAIALVWLLVACARGLLLLLNVRALAAIRREAWLWSTAHDYPVLLSNWVQLPCAAGFARAAIILPASLVENLRPEAVESIVVHEVAHLRRYDVWTNALARIAEAFVALNPAAWFVMRRLSMEREIACDDWVVARTGAGDDFAHTLAAMATRAGCRAPLAAPSAFGSRHAVVERIERLLDSRPRRLRLSPSALGGALVLLALIALTVQTVSPVLAYAPQPAVLAQQPAVAAAGTCAEPDHGIRWAPRAAGIKQKSHAQPVPLQLDLPKANAVIARAGTANVATFDFTVDASGRPVKVAMVSVPRYPAAAEDLTHFMMINRFTPATRNCVPVTSTIRTAMTFGTPFGNSSSTVTPVYPSGWSAQHASACKVPSLFHTGFPAFPDAMKGIAPGEHYDASVRVHVDAAGAPTNVAIVRSSGKKAFDDALLAAAQQAAYPLTETFGFKQVRPAGAPLSWNAVHGSATYTHCNPMPAEYVWTTTFERQVPIGIRPMSLLLQGARHERR